LALVLAISLCVASIIDFGYHAYQKTNLFISYSDPLTGQSRSESYYHDPELGGSIERDTDLHLQLDAAIALLALAAVLAISVELSKLSRRRKRLVFGAEAVVVTLVVVAGILWTVSLWRHLV
jgi:hypothetical protein